MQFLGLEIFLRRRYPRSFLANRDPVVRLLTWNCCMALHRKFDAVLRLQPDIAIICECAEPTRLAAFAGMNGLGSDGVWIGHNTHKGLAVHEQTQALYAKPAHLAHLAGQAGFCPGKIGLRI